MNRIVEKSGKFPVTVIFFSHIQEGASSDQSGLHKCQLYSIELDARKTQKWSRRVDGSHTKERKQGTDLPTVNSHQQ